VSLVCNLWGATNPLFRQAGIDLDKG
jgi:hypothetical protein